MLIVTDINGVTEALTDYKELNIKQRVNGDNSLSFVLLATERNEHSYPLVQEESIVEYDGNEYRIKKMDERGKGNRSIKQVQAQHVYFDLVDDYRYDIIGGTKTISDLLTFALTGTDFTYEVADTFDTMNVFNFGENNVITLINQVLELHQAEVELNGKHLVFKKQIGEITDYQFRYKHNLKTINKSVDTSKLATKIRGYWQGGFVDYTSTMSDVYGIRHAEPIRNDDVTDEASMLKILQRELNDEPNISFTIDAAHIYDGAKKGDEIFVIYEPLNIDITARIMETNRVLDWEGNVIKSTVTIANYQESVTDIFALLSNNVKQVEKKSEVNRSEIRQTNDTISLEVQRLDGDIATNTASITTNADNITLKVSETDYNGDTIIGKINISSSTVTIAAENVDLVGKVTFNDFTTTVQSTINGKEDKVNLGNLAYDDLVESAKLGTTVISGGYIKSDLLTADNIVVGTLSGDRIIGGTIVGSTLKLQEGALISPTGTAGINISASNIYLSDGVVDLSLATSVNWGSHAPTAKFG